MYLQTVSVLDRYCRWQPIFVSVLDQKVNWWYQTSLFFLWTPYNGLDSVCPRWHGRTSRPRRRAMRGNWAERRRCNGSHLQFALGTAGALAARETGQMRRPCDGKCVLTGTCTVGYGSSEQIPDACLTAQGLGATDLSQVLQTPLPFFFLLFF